MPSCEDLLWPYATYCLDSIPALVQNAQRPSTWSPSRPVDEPGFGDSRSAFVGGDAGRSRGTPAQNSIDLIICRDLPRKTLRSQRLRSLQGSEDLRGAGEHAECQSV